MILFRTSDGKILINNNAILSDKKKILIPALWVNNPLKIQTYANLIDAINTQINFDLVPTITTQIGITGAVSISAGFDFSTNIDAKVMFNSEWEIEADIQEQFDSLIVVNTDPGIGSVIEIPSPYQQNVNIVIGTTLAHSAELDQTFDINSTVNLLSFLNIPAASTNIVYTSNATLVSEVVSQWLYPIKQLLDLYVRQVYEREQDDTDLYFDLTSTLTETLSGNIEFIDEFNAIVISVDDISSTSTIVQSAHPTLSSIEILTMIATGNFDIDSSSVLESLYISPWVYPVQVEEDLYIVQTKYAKRLIYRNLEIE